MRIALILTVIFWQSYAEVRRVRTRVVQTPVARTTQTRSVTQTPESRTVETTRTKSCTPVRVNGEIIWRCK